MNKLIFLAIFTLLFTVPGLAVSKEKETATPTSSPPDTPSATATPQPRWVAPPVIDESSKIVKYKVNTFLRSDTSGLQETGLLDLSFKRRLDQYSVSAEGDVRFGKDFSNNDTADNISVMLAKITYAEPFLSINAGRFDVGEILSPMDYFGNYLTMGMRRLDGISVTLPITLSFGIVDYDKWQTPPTALSMIYIPNIFSSSLANYNSTQSYFLAQIRVTTKIADLPFALRLNYGQSSSDFYTYSVISQQAAIDASVDLTVAQGLDILGEFGDQNTSLFSETDAVAIGIRAKQLFTVGPLSFDDLILEYQIPLANSINNPFIGGNSFNNSAAYLPQNSFYGHLKARMKAVFVNFYITNSPGDFTFARLTNKNSILPNNQPIASGNEVEGLAVPLVASDYNNWAFMTDLGVEF